MTNEQAKFILNAYRPSGQDAADPALAEAMQHARLDPQVGEWLSHEKAHAASVSAKLREIALPSGLRNSILAGAQVTGDAANRNRLIWNAGLAAGICIAAAIAGFALPRAKDPGPKTSLAAFTIEDTRAGHHQQSGRIPAALNHALQDNKDLRHLPVDFAEFHAAGCRTLSVSGHDIFEFCFKRDGNWFHLYAALRKDFETLLAPEIVECFGPSTDGLNSVTWADGAFQFVVVSRADIECIRQLLNPNTPLRTSAEVSPELACPDTAERLTSLSSGEGTSTSRVDSKLGIITQEPNLTRYLHDET